MNTPLVIASAAAAKQARRANQSISRPREIEYRPEMGCRVASLLAMTIGLMLTPAAALAQAYQCTVPSGSLPVPQVRQDEPTRDLPVTHYTLALSWSPEFCRTRTASPRNARQCSGQAGRFGFVVHGLWPEGGGQLWPQWCSTNRQPSPADIRQNLCMTPDAALMAHEWAKHGSCMVRRPDTYFAVTRILWNSLRWPDYDRLSRKEDLTAGDIRTAFADANRHWEPDMIGLKVNERGWLEEMRLCYAKDFKPTRCTRQQFGPDDDAEVSIWRGL